jgi:hypothetical protein
MGYAIAASFTISNPEQLSHWQRVAMVYLACAGISALTAVGAVIALVRRGRRGRRVQRSNPPDA